MTFIWKYFQLLSKPAWSCKLQANSGSPLKWTETLICTSCNNQEAEPGNEKIEPLALIDFGVSYQVKWTKTLISPLLEDFCYQHGVYNPRRLWRRMQDVL